MLGMRIAALRHKAGLTQKQLANLLSVSPSAIGMYEQGRREPSADQSAITQLFQQAEEAAAPYTLRRPDGSEVSLDRQTLALLLAAFLGEP